MAPLIALYSKSVHATCPDTIGPYTHVFVVTETWLPDIAADLGLGHRTVATFEALETAEKYAERFVQEAIGIIKGKKTMKGITSIKSQNTYVLFADVDNPLRPFDFGIDNQGPIA